MTKAGPAQREPAFTESNEEKYPMTHTTEPRTCQAPALTTDHVHWSGPDTPDSGPYSVQAARDAVVAAARATVDRWSATGVECRTWHTRDLRVEVRALVECRCVEFTDPRAMWTQIRHVERVIAAARRLVSEWQGIGLRSPEAVALHDAVVTFDAATAELDTGSDVRGSRPAGTEAGGEGDPALTEATAWDTRSRECPEAPAPARRTGIDTGSGDHGA